METVRGRPLSAAGRQDELRMEIAARARECAKAALDVITIARELQESRDRSAA